MEPSLYHNLRKLTSGNHYRKFMRCQIVYLWCYHYRRECEASNILFTKKSESTPLWVIIGWHTAVGQCRDTQQFHYSRAFLFLPATVPEALSQGTSDQLRCSAIQGHMRAALFCWLLHSLISSWGKKVNEK